MFGVVEGSPVIEAVGWVPGLALLLADVLPNGPGPADWLGIGGSPRLALPPPGRLVVPGAALAVAGPLPAGTEELELAAEPGPALCPGANSTPALGCSPQLSSAQPTAAQIPHLRRGSGAGGRTGLEAANRMR